MPDCLPWQKSLDSCLRLSHLHNQIKRHGYNALGDRSFAYWDSDEVVVYHSARVIAVSVHKLFRGGDEWEETCSLSGPIDLQVLKFISENAQEEEQRLQSGRLARCSAWCGQGCPRPSCHKSGVSIVIFSRDQIRTR